MVGTGAVAQTVDTVEIEDDLSTGVQRNISSFRSLDWQPYFGDLRNGAVLVDLQCLLVNLFPNHTLCCGVCGFLIAGSTVGRVNNWVVIRVSNATIFIIFMVRKFAHAVGVRVLCFLYLFGGGLEMSLLLCHRCRRAQRKQI